MILITFIIFYWIPQLGTAQGTPIPQILWHSYGETLQEKSNIRIGDFVSSDGLVHSFVNLTQLDAQDAGLFTCSARNFLGKN